MLLQKQQDIGNNLSYDDGEIIEATENRKANTSFKSTTSKATNASKQRKATNSSKQSKATNACPKLYTRLQLNIVFWWEKLTLTI